MPNFLNLPAIIEDGEVHVVIETPRGSRAKFAFDPKLEAFAFSKSLLTGLTYPHDWGFVPSTKADNGDPLDIMVIHDAAYISRPGYNLPRDRNSPGRAEKQGKAERNDRFFAVSRRSHSELALHDVQDLSKPVREELEKFFVATDELEDKSLEIIGWKGAKTAMKVIQGAAKAFVKSDS